MKQLLKLGLAVLLLWAIPSQATITVVAMTKVPDASMEVYKAMQVTPSATAATLDTIVFVPSSTSAFNISNVAGDSGQVNVYFNIRQSAVDSAHWNTLFQVTAVPTPRIGSYVANEWITVSTQSDSDDTVLDRFRTSPGINGGDAYKARFIYAETISLASITPFDVIVYWRKSQARNAFAQ